MESFEMRQHLEVVVGDDGAVCVSASEVARLGARPGERLCLVREPGPLPAVLADAEVGEATPEVERVIAEARKSIAGGQVVRFASDEEFEAFLARNVDRRL